jgi:hypothetical protein
LARTNFSPGAPSPTNISPNDQNLDLQRADLRFTQRKPSPAPHLPMIPSPTIGNKHI